MIRLVSINKNGCFAVFIIWGAIKKTRAAIFSDNCSTFNRY
ncbi:hypothetical protein PREVCOP_04093 [Segatella copri DSM 18205]|uniref:Uncharacterized protein n=1 Tax=Segatella copri DSM 18205 TaxID=537011 RepID=D1PA68_9BACT|nr:hypothetical protein PREVCOP_04093 [Segatella copri DSM 18205]